MEGNIFNLQRFSVDDGPGIRTLVFLKGCPLHCTWCANPESQKAEPQVLYFNRKCKGCGKCLTVCPQQCIRQDEKFGLVVDHKACIRCGECVKYCYYGAREMCGKMMTVEEVMETVRKDKDFYKNSGGGMTVSGGEPFVQADFVCELFKACHEEGIRTAVETCGCCSWQNIEKSLPYLDLVFMDFKHYNSEIHKKFTGAGNEQIKENIRRMAAVKDNFIVRIPCIPGFNADKDTLVTMIDELEKMNVKKVEFLPYHRMGYNKYLALGREYELDGIPPMNRKELMYLKEYQEGRSIEIMIGGK